MPERGIDGVICGHIHAAAIRDVGIRYVNCGDWVDSCTAIVEHPDGTLELVRWGVAAPPGPPKREPALPSAALRPDGAALDAPVERISLV